jgi:hypothetical protein
LHGEHRAAQQALQAADRAAGAAVGEPPPPGEYWCSDGYWAVLRGRVLMLVDQEEAGRREVAAGVATMPDRDALWCADWVALADGTGPLHDMARKRR